MPLGTPILLTLYDKDDAPIQTCSRARIPVSIAERAIEFSDSLSGDDLNQDQLMAMYQLVVDFFGSQFTIDQLRDGADLAELIAVVQGIASRVAELMPASPSPTPPGITRRKKT